MKKGIMIGVALIAMSIGSATAQESAYDENPEYSNLNDEDISPAYQKLHEKVGYVTIACLIAFAIKGVINRVEKRKMREHGILWRESGDYLVGRLWEYGSYSIYEEGQNSHGRDNALYRIRHNGHEIKTTGDLHEAQMLCVGIMENKPLTRLLDAEMIAENRRWLNQICGEQE